MLDPTRILDAVTEEFDKILSGPGVSWNKVGMTVALNKAFSIAYAKILRELEDNDKGCDK